MSMNVLLRFYDNTRLASFKECPRKFFYGHVVHWRPAQPSAALSFGQSWHSAMNQLWPLAAKRIGMSADEIVEISYGAFCAEWESAGFPIDPSIDEAAQLAPRTPQIAKEMLYSYLEKRQQLFSDPSFELLFVERPFAVPLDPNDASLYYVGRLDKGFRFRNRVYIGEHKTTSSYRKDSSSPFRADFVDSFSPNAQIDGYLYAGRHAYGEEFGGVWIDAALVHKTVHNGFMFIPVERQPAQLDSWLWETHCWIDQVEGNKAALEVSNLEASNNSTYMAAFPKNTTACGNYGGCPYAPLCKALADPSKEAEAPMGYKIEKWSPFDELKLQQLGFGDEIPS